MSHAPSPASISDYALISDCQTCALASRDGSIDWYCPTRFDAPSVFARLLDPEGGHWSIRPVGAFTVERSYLADTMVLRTEFTTARGRVALTDALALEQGSRGHEMGLRVPRTLVRQVEAIEGEVELEIEFAPRIEYGMTLPLLERTDGGIVARGGPAELHLITNCVSIEIDDFMVTGRQMVRLGESLDFALIYRPAAGQDGWTAPDIDAGREIENARLGWSSLAEMHRTYDGPYREQVRRSALVLQALTYGPTGAVIAAATTSLPEQEGGANNWDYRFVWLRDLSLTVRALWIAACPDEARRLFHWVARANGTQREDGQPVQIMYGVEGERDLTEHELDHLEGFHGSRPVRIGNDAWSQKQHDVLGEVVDAVYLMRDEPGMFDPVVARLVSTLADKAAASWRDPDAGMWEARDRERHYLSSKVMCWVALDRAVKLAPLLAPFANLTVWEAARDELRQAILDRGWSKRAGAYTGAFESDQLDASVLLMPLVDFLPASDPRMRATIETIARDLVKGGLVHRWDGDDNGFIICTYWLVECLARAGDIARATELFERTTALANDVGLLAEEADSATGEQWGNFPQLFSHVGLINAAWSIGEAEQLPRQAS